MPKFKITCIYGSKSSILKLQSQQMPLDLQLMEFFDNDGGISFTLDVNSAFSSLRFQMLNDFFLLGSNTASTYFVVLWSSLKTFIFGENMFYSHVYLLLSSKFMRVCMKMISKGPRSLSLKLVKRSNHTSPECTFFLTFLSLRNALLMSAS